MHESASIVCNSRNQIPFGMSRRTRDKETQNAQHYKIEIEVKQTEQHETASALVAFASTTIHRNQN